MAQKPLYPSVVYILLTIYLTTELLCLSLYIC
jgi:hypothetical protein